MAYHVVEGAHRAFKAWVNAALNDDPQNPTIEVLPGFPDSKWIKDPPDGQHAVVFIRSNPGTQGYINTSQPTRTGEIQTGEGNTTVTYYHLGRALFQAHILLISKGEGAYQKIDDMHGRLLLYAMQTRKFGTDNEYVLEDFPKITLDRPQMDPSVQKRHFRRDATILISGPIVLEKAEHVVEEFISTAEVGEDVEP